MNVYGSLFCDVDWKSSLKIVDIDVSEEFGFCLIMLWFGKSFNEMDCCGLCI